MQARAVDNHFDETWPQADSITQRLGNDQGQVLTDKAPRPRKCRHDLLPLIGGQIVVGGLQALEMSDELLVATLDRARARLTGPRRLVLTLA
jgi:hypothetical protein